MFRYFKRTPLLLYYPAEFVKFSRGEFVWLVQGQVGDVLYNIYAFLLHVPGKVLVLCLLALACDVTRNLSSKGRSEHTRKFSAFLMILFWIVAAGVSSIYIVMNKVEFILWPTDSSKELVMNLIHIVVFVVPADLILMILNLVICCRIKSRKKEITRKRKVKKAGRMKVRRQRKQRGDITKVAEVQQMTKVIHEMLSSKSCEPGAENQQTSSNPSDMYTLNEMPTETKTFNNSGDSCDADVDEEVADQSALQENFDMTREEAKIESVTSFLFTILSITLLILPYVCKGPVCKEYVFFAVQIVVDIYGVIKPGIYAYADKEFRKRHKQLSPFACCCFRRIKCRTVPQQVETGSNLPSKETHL